MNYNPILVVKFITLQKNFLFVCKKVLLCPETIPSTPYVASSPSTVCWWFEEESGLDFSSVFCFFCLFVWNKEFLVRVPTKGVSLSGNNRGTIDT